MEKKMDDVKKGDKSKAEVLVTILQKMEACFLEVSNY